MICSTHPLCILETLALSCPFRWLTSLEQDNLLRLALRLRLGVSCRELHSVALLTTIRIRGQAFEAYRNISRFRHSFVIAWVGQDQLTSTQAKPGQVLVPFFFYKAKPFLATYSVFAVLWAETEVNVVLGIIMAVTNTRMHAIGESYLTKNDSKHHEMHLKCGPIK